MKNMTFFALLSLFLFVGCVSFSDPRNERYDRNDDYKHERDRYERTDTRNRDIRNHRNFDGVDFDASGNVHLSQGDRYEVRVEGDDESVRKLVSEVRGNVLKLYWRGNNSNWSSRNRRLNVYITAPNLRYLSIGGSGSMKLNRLETNHLHLNIDGSGSMNLQNVRTRSFKSDISGSGQISLSGNADRGTLDVSGSGSFDGASFSMRDAKVEISGSGRMKINASSNLDAEISGSGDILYRGNPRIRKEISGSGKIRQE